MKTVLIIGILLLVGCGPAIDIPGPGGSDFVTDLGNDFTLARYNSQDVRVHGPKDLGIPPRVTQIAWDEDVILAEQESEGAEEKRYWIIESRIAQLHGPFGADEFIMKRQQLNVPEELEVRDVHEFKP